MGNGVTIRAVVDPIIEFVGREELRDALAKSFAAERDAVETIEKFFEMLPRARWSRGLLCTVLGSWKAENLW